MYRSISLVAATVALALGLVASAIGGIGSVPPQNLGSSHGLKYVGGSFSPFGIGGGAVFADCPETAAVVGGGLHFSGPAPESRVEATHPGDDSDADTHPEDFWVGEVHHFTASDRTITVYAVCRKAGIGPVRYVSHDANPGAPGTTVSTKVKCPGKTAVSGGGGVVGFNNNMVVSAPFDGPDPGHRPDDGWRIKTRGSSGQARADAVCLKPGAGRLTYRSTSASVGAGKARTLAASCPKDTAVTGGGISITGDASSRFIHSTRPRDSGADANTTPDDRWSATAVNNGLTAAAKITVRAICLA